jgi:hypothetical protein
MQVDVQATLPDAHVLVARPIMFDIGQVSRRVLLGLSTGTLVVHDVVSAIEHFQTLDEVDSKKFAQAKLEPLSLLLEGATRLDLPFSSQFLGLAQQIINIDWEKHLQGNMTLAGVVTAFMSTSQMDPTEADRQMGVCPLPFFELTEQNWELLLSGKHIDEVQELLKKLGVYQYFYPAPEHLLLGLAEKHLSKEGSIIKAAEVSPVIGHPIGKPELFPDAANIVDALEAIKAAGYVAEAEVGYTLTSKGQEIRQTMKVRPREGFLEKLSRVLQIKLDINSKDFR